MALRRPLALIAGLFRELPLGDAIPIEAGGTGVTTAAAARDALAVREKLSAARTYYVRTDGSDSNDGLSNTAGGAFLTIQKAVDVAASLDLGIYDITIRCRGVFSSTTVLKSIIGSGRVVIRGDADDTLTMSVAVSGTSVNAFEFGPGFQGTYRLQYMAISSAGGSGVTTGGAGPANVEIANVAFGACNFYHVWAASNQVIDFVGPCSISGGSFAFARSSDSAVVRMNQAFTLTGTPAFGSGFVVSERAAGIVATLASFIGSATGNRYQVTLNAYIFVNGAGASFLPGSSAGVASTGGQYA